MGGHKGYGLSVIAEVLAGALTGGTCSHFGVDRVANNMLSIILDPAVFQSTDGFSARSTASSRTSRVHERSLRTARSSCRVNPRRGPAPAS